MLKSSALAIVIGLFAVLALSPGAGGIEKDAVMSGFPWINTQNGFIENGLSLLLIGFRPHGVPPGVEGGVIRDALK